MPIFLLNVANLHVGGAIQVAASVVYEWSLLPEARACIHIVASTEVDQNLRNQGVNLSLFGSYKVWNSMGLKGVFSKMPVDFSDFEVVFTLFGPLYAHREPKFSVVGFAQPWIIYPDNVVYPMLGLFERARTRAKFWLQKCFFGRADMLIVELAHVREGLVRQRVISTEHIRVVPNALSSLYADPSRWMPLTLPNAGKALRLGFVGRNYIHKNTRVFPAVAHELRAVHGVDARFVVTFTAKEWQACSPAFRAACDNVGPLDVAQCPSFYQALDGVVFPSLLECFSATPLEAMAMERPLFASDRGFVRDVCADHAYYFDPMDPKSIAASIAGHFKGEGSAMLDLAAARRHAFSFSSAEQRARQYLDCLLELADAQKPVPGTNRV